MGSPAGRSGATRGSTQSLARFSALTREWFTGTFAEPTFRTVLGSRHEVVGLVTQPDRPVGEARGSTRQVGEGMKPIAEQHGVPVFQPQSVNTPEGVAQLEEWRPDLLVVAAYGQILSNDVLSVPPQGGINVHASLLPKYRGAAPIAWAIYHGEKQTGVTIIKMSVHLDAGDMLAQQTVVFGSAMDLKSEQAAQLPEGLLRHREEVLALEEDLAGDDPAWRLLDQAEDRHGRHALARPRLTDDTQRLAGMEIPADIVDGLDHPRRRDEFRRQTADR